MTAREKFTVGEPVVSRTGACGTVTGFTNLPFHVEIDVDGWPVIFHMDFWEPHTHDRALLVDGKRTCFQCYVNNRLRARASWQSGSLR